MTYTPLTKILCPIDFSPTSRGALSHATKLAKQFGASLHLVHVWDLPITPMPFGEGMIPFGPAEIAELREAAEAQLRDAMEELRDPDVSSEAHLIFGIAAEAIVKEAVELNCDAIVMGTHGRSGLPRLMLGSVTERVVRAATIPVYVVPRHEGEMPAPREISRIVCPVDFSAPSDAALRYALAIARLSRSELHVVHVWQSSDAEPRREAELERELEELVHRHATPEDRVARQLRKGVPYVEIVLAAEELDADWIVMGTMGRTGLEHFMVGSVAERVLRSSALPVTVVRAP